MHWYSIDCLFMGRSELLHQAHMSMIIYCCDKTINLVRHPNSKAEKSAIAGIQTRVPNHDLDIRMTLWIAPLLNPL